MKRWNNTKSKEVEAPEVDVFLEDIRQVCVKHGLALSHEDEHGAFKVVKLDAEMIVWLFDAFDSREEDA